LICWFVRTGAAVGANISSWRIETSAGLQPFEFAISLKKYLALSLSGT
jgi:hypothetical protein